ncbi:MAG: hypothetical protein ACI4MS_06470 [Candidatus Coproplasma sp.]
MKNKIRLGMIGLCGVAFTATVCGFALQGNTRLTTNSPFNGHYSSGFVAFAEENTTDNTQTSTELLTETKGMLSKNLDYLLITTGIKIPTENLKSAYKAIGYKLSVDGVEQADIVSDTYYTGISVKTGETSTYVYNISDIFPETVTGESETTVTEVTAMIVAEIEYNPTSVYTIQAFITDNSDNTAYATEKTKTEYEFTVTLKEDCGVTFSEGTTETKLTADSALPEITNNTGRTIAGWYSTDETQMWANGEFKMPVSNVEIAPYFAPEAGTALIPCSGKTNSTIDKNYKPDYFDKLNATAEDKATEEYKAKYDIANNIGLKDAVVGGEKGIELTFTPTLVADDYFRMLTAVGTNGVQAGHNYRFNYVFENRGTQEVSFEVIQVQGGVKITEEEGAVSAGVVTIPVGEVKEVSIEINLTGNNSNAMTVIVMQGETEGMVLGVAMSKEDDIILNPDTKYTLTIGGNGVTFENGETTAQLAEGEKMPTVVNNVTGREIVGWYSASTTYSTDFIMPASDTTISPVFSVQSGFTALDAGGEQSGRVPSNNCTEVLPADFSAMGAYGSAVIAGGADGYAELGSVLICNKAMTTSARFRLNTKVNDVLGKQVTLGKNHQFAYNFENKGTVDIHLKMYQINTGTNITDNIYVDIDLKPGESMSVVLTANFATGNANKNALSYFAVTQNMEAGMSLGISMSVKLAS